MSGDVSVRVFCRFRPFNSREKALGGDSSKFLTLSETGIKINDAKAGSAGQSYEFDHIFGLDTRQEDMYDIIGRPTVEDIFRGFNGTIFAYGQTGSGKSFSMMGEEKKEKPELAGLIPRATEHIFSLIHAEARVVTFSVSVSYLEVYREVIRDLLDPSKVNLRIRESPQKGVYVEGLTTEFVQSEADVLAVLAIGDESRATASTNMNAVSSRSHSLLILHIHQSNEEDGSSKAGQLNLVDLAGSEKVGKTGAAGDTLEEAKKINQSLSALSGVIKALADGKSQHVPYRDSKLTRILQTSLGGNTKTSLVLAASPHMDNAPETISTLRFGQRAKTIKTKVKVNERRSAEELAKILERVQAEMVTLRGYVSSLEKKLSEAGIALPTGKETASAAKAMKASVGGPEDVGLREDHAKLQEKHSLALTEIDDLKAEELEAKAEARQAERREAIVTVQLERFQGLAKLAAAEIKGLRAELSQRTNQRANRVNRVTSLTLDLVEKDAEVALLKKYGISGPPGDEQENARVQEMKQLREETAELQVQLRADYETKAAAMREENQTLKKQLEGDDETMLALRRLRWDDEQADKLMAAQRVAKTVEQQMMLAHSAADQRVADAQDDAAFRVSEAHETVERKLHEATEKSDRRLTEAEAAAEAQRKLFGKNMAEKASELILQQKEQWEKRVQEIEAAAAGTLADAKQQAEAAREKAAAEAADSVAMLGKTFEEREAFAAVAAEAQQEALAKAQAEASERDRVAGERAEAALAAVRTESSKLLANAKQESEAGLRGIEAHVAQNLAKVVADANEKVSAVETRETARVMAAEKRAQEELAAVKEAARQELAAAAAEVEQSKSAAHEHQQAMAKREQERIAAAAESAAQLEKKTEEAIAACKAAAAAELAAAAERSKVDLERSASEAAEVLRRKTAELRQQADSTAAAAEARQTALQEESRRTAEQLEELQQAKVAGDSGATEMIGSIQREAATAKAELAAARTELETLLAANDAAGASASATEATLAAKLSAAEASFEAKSLELTEKSTAQVTDVQKQCDADIAAAKAQTEADAAVQIEAANDGLSQARREVQGLEAKVQAAASKLGDTEKKAAEKFSDIEARWLERHTEATDRAKAAQDAHAQATAKLTADWEAKLAAAEERERATAAGGEQKLEDARIAQAGADKAAAQQRQSDADKMAAVEGAERATEVVQRKLVETQREHAAMLDAERKEAAGKLTAERREFEQKSKKDVADVQEAAAAELAAARKFANERQDAETARIAEQADERVAAAEAAAEVRVAKEKQRAQEDKASLEAEKAEMGRKIELAVVEEQKKARAAMSDMRNRMEDDQMTAIDEMTLKFEALLAQKDAESKELVRKAVEDAEQRVADMGHSGLHADAPTVR